MWFVSDRDSTGLDDGPTLRRFPGAERRFTVAGQCRIPTGLRPRTELESRPRHLDVAARDAYRVIPAKAGTAEAPAAAGPEGLVYRAGFLGEEREGELLARIDEESSAWLGDLARRVQHDGYKYDYSSRGSCGMAAWNSRTQERQRSGERAGDPT